MQLDRGAGGLVGDLTLYLLSAAFAAVTAVASTLAPHRAWGAVAVVGYAAAALVVVGQLAVRRTARQRLTGGGTGDWQPTGRATRTWLTGGAARAWLTGVTWAAVVAVPLVMQAEQRADGRTDRAQEEVVVVDDGGASRLLADGSPYLSEQQIAALPADERLLGYLPYQPGMAIFGLPRALAGTGWWTDARIWFAVATVAALAAALALARRRAGPAGDRVLVRAAQLSTVLPIAALAMSTGGDDLPVLALALLALVLCTGGRYAAAGTAIGAAAALKLFAWPILLVLLCHAATRDRRAVGRVAAGGITLPLLALVPVAVVDHAALIHNVLGFPLGAGMVSSPAASPLPGMLISTWMPGGRIVAGGLLLAVGLAIAVRLVRRPPRTAAAAALICGLGLLAATLLLPSTRFGYLLYPVALFSWVPVLRVAEVQAQAFAPDRDEPLPPYGPGR
ncbi:MULTISPECIES: glycosyltransferase 87 family protein [unclassified Solwaraspora]|uniref:glycosyltransferase 87 family protein n=1 Tax=unclassified Solwaraspora TaxID=2627926 RepID=UPI00248C651B|nr:MULTISPECIES: glycosyltransferase 87 family protein [unclassified Solwaraspora]WBC00481.1 glycosyltransferase 87 family protein [Solwaraspora sp. WMMA2059]WBC23910.1 glycosyltransferase 87 family protein [Solwaraspora sp. WMMA2080]WJK37873.1 glycosyltransferase 87 family protein [Solwaraspora sp. WMMA2065]